ncbi:cysteine hydrolase family protein [Rhodoligotrophos ferricapiens]|uniref:cysteine hydrolase family protein n=1 Tax=Rhodoligotrophos ferricapiens TaxID=3069264 RepID=UPI00315DFA97
MTAEQTALLILDLQNEMVDPKGKVGGGGLAKVVQDRGVIEKAQAVIGAARDRGITVAYIRVGFRADYADALSVAPRVKKMKEHGACVLGTWATEFPEAIAPQPGELIFTKQCVNPFFNTGLMTWLMRHGKTRLAIGGVVTNLVVESTARAGDDAGFAMTVLEDICAAPNPEWHRFAIENTLPLFATISSSKEFIGSVAA